MIACIPYYAATDTVLLFSTLNFGNAPRPSSEAIRILPLALLFLLLVHIHLKLWLSCTALVEFHETTCTD